MSTSKADVNKTCTINVQVPLTKKQNGAFTVGEAKLTNPDEITNCMKTTAGEAEGPGTQAKNVEQKSDKKTELLQLGDVMAKTTEQQGLNPVLSKQPQAVTATLGQNVKGGKKSRRRKGGRKSKRRSSKKARKSK